MARRDFGAMLSNIDQEPQVPEPVDPTETVKPASTPAPKVTKKVDKSPRRPAAVEKPTPRAPARPQPIPAKGVAGGVGFDKLERKETRLSTDQYAELTTIARDLNRRRAGEGHRITENTLIRLGIDLLRERAGDLSGATEAELRASLQLP